MKKVALIIFIIMLIIALVHNRTNILMFLKSCVNHFRRHTGFKIRNMTIQAYNDEDVIRMVMAEEIYYDEERNYVIINKKGKHIPPRSLRQIEKYLFKLSPLCWLFNFRELRFNASEVIGFVLCNRKHIVWSPNIVLPPREEWLNEKYMDEIIEILSLDNQTKEVYEVYKRDGEEFKRYRYVKPYRFQELIRKSNPKYWNDKKWLLLTQISMEELNKLSKCFDGEKLVM